MYIYINIYINMYIDIRISINLLICIRIYMGKANVQPVYHVASGGLRPPLAGFYGQGECAASLSGSERRPSAAARELLWARRMCSSQSGM